MEGFRLSQAVSDDQRHSLEAEAALLGSMILDPSIVADVGRQVGAGAFFRPENRRVYEAIRDQVEDSGHVDLVLLRRRLADGGALQTVGGVDYLVELAESVPSAASWPYYARIVADKAAFREVLARLDEAVQAILNAELPLADRLDRARAALANVQVDNRAAMLELIAAGSVEPTPVRWLAESIVPLGMLTLLAGEPGLGKTFLCASLAAAVTRGRRWPTPFHEPAATGSVIILSDEDDLQRVLLPRLLAHEADADRVHVQDAMALRPFHVVRGLGRLRATLEKLRDVRLVILDPITAYMDGINANNNAEVRSALVPLQRLAEQHDVAIVGVSHFSKKVDLAAVHRTLGSTAFTAAARSVWAIVRDRRGEDRGRRCLMPVKCNYAIDPAGYAFRIAPPLGQVQFEPMMITADVDEVMGLGRDDRRTERPATQTAQAARWLTDRLADEPAYGSDVLREAADEGFAKSTVQRAAQHLGVQKIRSKDDGNRFLWSLRFDPDASDGCRRRDRR